MSSYKYLFKSFKRTLQQTFGGHIRLYRTYLSLFDMDCVPYLNAMDALRKIRFPTLEGFINAFTLRPQESPPPEQLQVQVPASEQETEPQDEAEQANQEGEEDEWLNRRDFETARAIADMAFKELLLQHLDPEEDQDPRDIEIMDRSEGSYNHCVIAKVKTKGWFVVKVPAHGTKVFWTEADAFNLRSEVYTMKYIRRHTKVPVPQIFGWNTTLDNVIGAPYILMETMSGYPAYEVWKPEIEEPSQELEETRRKILQSLASIMAELQNLQFDKLGMLHFEEDPDVEDAPAPMVGHFFAHDGKGNMVERPTYLSTAQYFNAKLNDFKELLEPDQQTSEEFMGEQFFLRLAYDEFPRSSPNGEPETFVLAHPDLDFQNIWVTREGEVTGLIDWEDTRTVPRPVGYAALPLFLRKDWEVNYHENMEMMPWALDKYRNIYLQFIGEASSAPETDAKFTLKSTLYCAAIEAAENRAGGRQAFVDRMFKEVPCLHAVDPEHFMCRLGSDEGWASGELMLMREFEKLFSP